MCFEFEWLYWAQLAQEKEQRRREADEQAGTAAAQAPEGKPLPQHDDTRQPAHA